MNEPPKNETPSSAHCFKDPFKIPTVEKKKKENVYFSLNSSYLPFHEN